MVKLEQAIWLILEWQIDINNIIKLNLFCISWYYSLIRLTGVSLPSSTGHVVLPLLSYLSGSLICQYMIVQPIFFAIQFFTLLLMNYYFLCNSIHSWLQWFSLILFHFQSFDFSALFGAVLFRNSAINTLYLFNWWISSFHFLHDHFTTNEHYRYEIPETFG